MKDERYVRPRRAGHRWYLAEWAAHFGKTQADAQRAMGWPKSNTSYLFNGRQRYTQDLIDDAAKWLGIAPFELLMPPSEALALRSIRQSAMAIAAEEGRPFEHDLPFAPRRLRTGTRG